MLSLQPALCDLTGGKQPMFFLALLIFIFIPLALIAIVIRFLRFVSRIVKENNKQFGKNHRPMDMSEEEYAFYKEWNGIE